ncbi:hypothetical protein YC2023_024551 [Brassica napus]
MEMPSTHLSVKELHTVSCGEIRNLIKWRKNFGSVVLIMFCCGQVLHGECSMDRYSKTLRLLIHQRRRFLFVADGNSS